MPTRRNGRADETAGGDRNARRREATRARLVEAAQTVMAEKGVDGATIAEITETADLGFGTFYNHFQSKEAVCEAVSDYVIGPWTVALDELGETMTDPAQNLAASLRHTLRRAVEDSRWGWFLVRTGPWLLRSRLRINGHLARTIRSGIDTGRFTTADTEVAVNAVVGTLLANLQALLDADLGPRAPESVAAVCLCQLGIATEEAAAIANSELPAMPGYDTRRVAGD